MTAFCSSCFAICMEGCGTIINSLNGTFVNDAFDLLGVVCPEFQTNSLNSTNCLILSFCPSWWRNTSITWSITFSFGFLLTGGQIWPDLYNMYIWKHEVTGLSKCRDSPLFVASDLEISHFFSQLRVSGTCLGWHWCFTAIFLHLLNFVMLFGWFMCS